MAKPLNWSFDPETGEVRRENEVLGTFNKETGVFTWVSRDLKEKYRAKVPRILKDHDLTVLSYAVEGESEPPTDAKDDGAGDDGDDEEPIVPPLPVGGTPAGAVVSDGPVQPSEWTEKGRYDFGPPQPPEPAGALGDKDPDYVRMLHRDFPEAFRSRYGVLTDTPGTDGRYPATRTTVLTFRA